VLLRAFLLTPALLFAQSDLGFPGYSAASVANAAANVAGLYAPNTLISIYGFNLSVGTQAVSAADVRGGTLPTTLGSTLVRVLLDGQFANLYYASPFQVNVLIPPHLLPGQVKLTVVVSGRAGPPVPLQLEESAPGLFEADAHFVVATHGNGPLVTSEFPASSGEIIVLYATGLGPTSPPAQPNRIPTTAAQLTNRAAFHVWLNGVPVPKDHVLYAGLTPGFAGLFQINLQVPANTPPDPEIRVGSPERRSPPDRFLRLR
jgi:uncharacterized protein (TIGR03437 family)